MAIKNYIDVENVEIPAELKGKFGASAPIGFSIPKSKKFSFKASATMQIPNELSYENEISLVHNQNPYGTCYCESATTLLEWFVWKQTGKKLTFTRNEVWDLCGDFSMQYRSIGSYSDREAAGNCAISDNTQHAGSYITAVGDIIDGGLPHYIVNLAYYYNSKLDQHYWTNKKESEICKYFKNFIDNSGKSIDNSVLFVNSNVDAMKYAMFKYGPVATNIYWNGVSSQGHTILAVAYDKDAIYIRNSWGSTVLIRITWSNWKSWCMHPSHTCFISQCMNFPII